MPKMKTKRATAKRMKITGTGKIKYKKPFMRHKLTHKSPKAKRQKGKAAILGPANHGLVARTVPYGIA